MNHLNNKTMKFKMLKTSFWLLGLCLTLGFTVISCDDDDDDDTPSNEVRYQNLTLTGPKEVPANPSTNTGTFNGVYNMDTNVINYTITWTGFTATNMHFHKITDPNPGPVTLPIPKDPNSATPAVYVTPLNGSLTLTDAQETELLAGQWYVNIHSDAYKGGEIRVNVPQK
jgi:hypothetical protein